MPKLVTTLDSTAYANWNTREGIRDMLQNGRDAELQYGAKLSVALKRSNPDNNFGTLHVTNEGASLPLKALLTGFTTKRGNGRLAGQYGEGLPAACLALVRAGHMVTIRTSDEVWHPYIEEHPQAGAPVLAFDIKNGRADRNRVSVEIGGVERAMWKAFKAKFLFLDPKDEINKNKVEVDSGTLLLSPEYVGDVYVKGIWVLHDPQLEYGYDLKHAKTDRDRKMVDSYELERYVSVIWQEALVTRPDLIANRFVKMVASRVKDTEGISSWNVSGFSPEAKQAVVDDFIATHGKDAIPVTSLAQSEAVGHLGKRGILVSKGHHAILEAVLGNASTTIAKLATEATTRYGWADLTPVEQTTLAKASHLLNAANTHDLQRRLGKLHVDAAFQLDPCDAFISLEGIEVVDFRSADLEGLFHKTKEGKTTIQLAKRILFNRADTLATLIHEKCHEHGGDGSKEHIAAIEDTWSKVVEYLRSKQ